MQHPDTKLCNRVNMIIRDGILVKTVRYVRVQSLSFHAYRIYSIKRRRSDGSKITNKRRPGIHAAPNQKNAARIIISVQLCNLHHPDNYDSVSAK